MTGGLPVSLTTFALTDVKMEMKNCIFISVWLEHVLLGGSCYMNNIELSQTVEEDLTDV